MSDYDRAFEHLQTLCEQSEATLTDMLGEDAIRISLDDNVSNTDDECIGLLIVYRRVRFAFEIKLWRTGMQFNEEFTKRAGEVFLEITRLILQAEEINEQVLNAQLMRIKALETAKYN